MIQILSQRTYKCLSAVLCLGFFLVHMSVAAQDAAIRYLTDRGDPPMSAVIGYSAIGADSAIFVDNTDTIFLLVSDLRKKVIGQKGRGACEHQDVTSYAFASDTLFILDRELGRVTGYSVHSGECVSEISSPELSRFSQIGKFGSWFYLARNNYNSASSKDEALFYRLDYAGQLDPLDLTVEDLEASLILMPIRMSRRIPKVQSRGDKLYFILPLSQRIWQYDTQTQSFSFIDLMNDSPDISKYSFSTDPEELSKLMLELEFELDIFLLDDQVVVLSSFQNQFRLGAYSYAGNLIAKERGVPHVDFEEKGNLYSLKATDSETDLYSLELVDLPGAR